MCVIYRSNWIGDVLARFFRKVDIPCHLLGNARARRAFRLGEESVKLMTMHSSKGLEFPMVAVSGLGYLPVPQSELADEAKLLYVALTRATDNLLLTTHRETPFVNDLYEVLTAAVR